MVNLTRLKRARKNLSQTIKQAEAAALREHRPPSTRGLIAMRNRLSAKIKAAKLARPKKERIKRK